MALPSLPHARAQEEAAPPADQPQAAADDAAAPDDAAGNAAGGNAAAGNAAAPPQQDQKFDKWGDDHSIPRHKSPVVFWLKLLVLWLWFVIWVKSADWVNRDSQIFDLGYGKWNPILYFPFVAVLLLVAFPIPILGLPMSFLVAAIVLPICYLATFVPYVVTRNKAVQLHQKVFTPDWFRYEIAHLLSKVGVKMSAERLAEYERGAPVDLMALGAAEERDNQANLITARQSPGYLLVKDLVADMADRRSDKAILDYTQQSVVVRQHIDGVWHNSEARERESSDVMLAVMKTLANLNAAERRKKQEGKFGAKYKEHSYVCPIVSQGVPTGERVMMQLLGGYQRAFRSYEDLGMRAKLGEQWSALMARDKGLLVIAGMPEGGVTTLTDVSLMETDRLLRDFASVEEEQHRERDIENIEVTTYSAANGQTAATVIPALIRKYPNVYVLRDLSDTEAAKLLLAEVRDDERLLVTNVHAKEAGEAPIRLLQKKVPQRDLAATLTAVMCTRLVRKLCDSCKVAYAPTPDLLKKLGIPQGKIEALYRVPKPEEIDKPCPECSGLGFKGRTGLFELMVVDDKIREIILKQPQLDLLRKAARAAGTRSYQEEGLLLVAKGVTSLAELQRVLKE
ncbi:MAG TPA: ATPase, T2SS/T4P/T4SS family [Lacipirellulaceae bacterium]|jgi:type II secretory ATPase GspE/PulE/Tfp pilus assembly ATPase PilB-like protein|nr:ATPase, T2SS/T4P/T4SS family [Lacipirellulaceae bacterium]